MRSTLYTLKRPIFWLHKASVMQRSTFSSDTYSLYNCRWHCPIHYECHPLPGYKISKHRPMAFFRQSQVFMEKKIHKPNLWRITLPLILIFLYASLWVPWDMSPREVISLGKENPDEGLGFDWDLVCSHIHTDHLYHGTIANNCRLPHLQNSNIIRASLDIFALVYLSLSITSTS